MKEYTVVIEKAVENTFVGLNLGEGGYTEFDDFDMDDNEVWKVFTNRDIEVLLNQIDSVISYTISE